MNPQQTPIEDILDKKMTIRDAISSGYMSLSIIGDFGMWQRVQILQHVDGMKKTHAIERAAEECGANEKTVWRAIDKFGAITDKLLSVE